MIKSYSKFFKDPLRKSHKLVSIHIFQVLSLNGKNVPSEMKVLSRHWTVLQSKRTEANSASCFGKWKDRQMFSLTVTVITNVGHRNVFWKTRGIRC